MTGKPQGGFFQRSRAAAALLLFLFAACAGKPEPVKAFLRGDLDAAVNGFAAEAAKRDKNFALHSAQLGSAAITAGYYDLADQAFQGASKVMWSTGAGELRGLLSLISAESLKVWKGEPFEKAMASFYLGLLYYMRGEYDNAAAGFRKAILANKQADENHREEYAVAFYMLARCLARQKDLDGAKVALAKAKKIYPGNPYFDLDKIQRSNFVLIVETGIAPEKYRHGPGASLDAFREVKTADAGAEVTVGRFSLGAAAEAFDLYLAAKNRGSSGKDVVQGTKGVLRDAAIATAVISDNQWVSLGAGLFAVANQSQADIRQWEILPQRVAIMVAYVPPGSYDLRIDFLDSSGYKLPQYSQQWSHVSVRADRDNLYLFRALPKQGGNIERVRPPQTKPQSAEEKNHEKDAG